MGRRRREEGEISVCEGLGERWHERKGVAGWGRWRQIESRARRDCPGEQRRAAVLHGENHDTATIRITNQRLAVEKVDGISQRRRIPRRLVVDVDVVVPDATRESLPLLDYLNFHLRENPRHLVASPRMTTSYTLASFSECLCAWRSLSIRDDRVKNEHRGSRGDFLLFGE